jgi:predicted HTH domain antitoxin
MTLTIPNDLLDAARLDERAFLIEMACHLFNIDRLTLFEAARLARLSRADFEDELHRRRIAIHRLDVQDLREDMRSLEHFDGLGN